MPRPRRSEHTKESILERGIDLFSEQGVHGTGLKQILDAVQVPKGSFYNYFDSKEHFVAEVVESYTNRSMAQVEAFLEGNTASATETFKQLFELLTKMFELDNCVKGCLVGSLAAEVAGSSELCRLSLQKGMQRWHALLAQLVEQGQAEGEFRSDMSKEVLVELLWCAWEGGILKMKIEGQSDALRRVVRNMMSLVRVPDSPTIR